MDMDLTRLRGVLARGGNHLGDVLWWTLSDAEIERPRLTRLWLGAGLDARHLPEPNSAEKTLKNAVRECQVGQPDVLMRPALENEHQLVYAIIREHRDGTGVLSYQQEASLVLLRASASLICDTPAHPLGDAVRCSFSRLLVTHTADDIRRAMIRQLEASAAITLRDHGGVYWVPASYSSQLRQLQAVVQQIGSSRLHLLPIHDSEEGRATLSEAVQTSLDAELAQLKVEIDGFLAEPPERASTLTRRLEMFEGIRARAGLYRDVLQVSLADLESQLLTMTATVEALLDAKGLAA